MSHNNTHTRHTATYHHNKTAIICVRHNHNNHNHQDGGGGIMTTNNTYPHTHQHTKHITPTQHTRPAHHADAAFGPIAHKNAASSPDVAVPSRSSAAPTRSR